MIIFGTRPEAIKMAPVVQALKEKQTWFKTVIVVTGQHREMLDQVLTTFRMIPDYDLDVMMPKQSLPDLTAVLLQRLTNILKKEKPDIVLVQGDTTTAAVASLAAFYEKIAIGHIEAGLRTGDKYAPFPEEMNRQMISVLADIHFAPTKNAAEHLYKQDRCKESVIVTGNTAIDALKMTVKEPYEHPLLQKLKKQRFLLLTVHRRENIGEPLQRIFQAVKHIVAVYQDIHVVYPLHFNPLIRKQAAEMINDHPRIHLIEPLDVIEFHNFIARAYAVLTDSGGVQEEAPTLGVPVLVLRDTTERPEGVETGALKLVGTKEEAIFAAVKVLLEQSYVYEKMSRAQNPYGDGYAAKRIVSALLQRYQLFSSET